jgi:hypothetical protein
LAQIHAGLLRFWLLVFACLGFAACTGGPHPEPPSSNVVAPGTGGSHGAMQGSGTGGSSMGAHQMPGTGGTNDSTAGSGGQSGTGGSKAEDGGVPVCPHDTGDMDAGASCAAGGDDDAGALH